MAYIFKASQPRGWASGLCAYEIQGVILKCTRHECIVSHSGMLLYIGIVSHSGTQSHSGMLLYIGIASHSGMPLLYIGISEPFWHATVHWSSEPFWHATVHWSRSHSGTLLCIGLVSHFGTLLCIGLVSHSGTLRTVD